MPKNRKLQNIIGTEHITDAAEAAIAAQASGGATVAFKNFAVSGQDNIVADAATDTLNVAGAGSVSVTTNASTDTLTITGTDTQLSTEQVQDIVGAMFTGNTETGITATYEDSDGTIDLVASGGSPGGSDGQMQYNNGGSFGGSSLVYTDTTDAEQFKIDVSSSVAPLVIVQEGTGNSFEVHDAADPDNNRFQIDASGNVTIKGLNGGGWGQALYVAGHTISNTYRAETATSATTPSFASAYDTNTGMFFPAADNLGFSTGGTERFRFGSSGEILIGGTAAGTSGQVLTSGGSGAAVSWAAAGGANDFDMQITQSGVISGNQRHILNKIPGWGSHGNSWQTRSNQDDPLFRPFIAPHTGNITEIGINCSTADATSTTKITLAIYSDNDGVPHTKLGAVDIPCASTGAQYVTSGFGTISLTRGTQYWWGFCRNNQTNTVAVRSMSQSDHIWIGPWNAVTNVENYQVSLRLNSSANTMPSTITASDLQGFYNNTCLCGIKIG